MKKTYSLLIFIIVIIFYAQEIFAQSTALTFPVIDQLMCGFIVYSKSKLAPYIAVICVVITVIGHWLGITKIWGALLYISIGLGLIMGIGSIITNVTGSAASCIV